MTSPPPASIRAYYELYLHTISAAPEKRIPAVAESARQRLTRSLAVLEKVLGQRELLAGAYSIADIANAVVVRGLRERMPEVLSASTGPHVEAWFARVTARPAWQSATAK